MEKIRAILGVTAGIAVYKAVELLRSLDKAGFDVQVVMTKGATEFVAPLTFQSLSHKPVAVDMFNLGSESKIPHIETATAAQVAVIAPATADFLARHAAGMADDLLTTLLLVARCPIVIAPSMNTNMWENPLVQRNLSTLAALPRYSIVQPESGELACGTSGSGRLPRIETITEAVIAAVTPQDLAGRSIFINAGPTQEPIDNVRFLSNMSSGKMGYALALKAKRRGARVTLVSGPTALEPPDGVKVIQVKTAREMHQATMQMAPGSDMAILTAAVADWRPASFSQSKIKKTGDRNPTRIELVENDDILADLCRRPNKPPVVIGFAAEDESSDMGQVINIATQKLRSKNCDLIVLNTVDKESTVFGSDYNTIYIIDDKADNKPPQGISDTKASLADHILTYGASRLAPASPNHISG